MPSTQDYTHTGLYSQEASGTSVGQTYSPPLPLVGFPFHCEMGPLCWDHHLIANKPQAAADGREGVRLKGGPSGDIREGSLFQAPALSQQDQEALESEGRYPWSRRLVTHLCSWGQVHKGAASESTGERLGKVLRPHNKGPSATWRPEHSFRIL